ncbi:hypothetical protein KO506_03060 [Polaribacter vadi]|uniref:hypothetical protein n=1 Tax=Polaribacter TaxID=52959 RepID=UPI001C07FB8B|nr:MULTISPECIES: hypothetical protein [Polaribacter]MBU3010367.1 hypothetical protein [Polaribacter vadi]MDO6740174.1 hypothetical protein [Polaribacter sp. 1_MG-2023]
MRFKTLFFSVLFISTSIFSQQSEQQTKPEDTSLKGQFDKIYRISTTYQVYKVIDKEKFLKLKSNVLDSLQDAKNLILEKENLLKTERENIKKTKETLAKTKTDLEVSNLKENSISLLGIQLSKVTYNLVLWSIIVISLLALFYFIFKFSRSNVLTKQAQNNLIDVEQEFENHRKKSIEREQKLRRELQDEINKHRNS